MVSHRFHDSSHEPSIAPIPFPRLAADQRWETKEAGIEGGDIDDMMTTLDTVSRRIHDLARELKCLGYFDDENADRPRAA